MGAGFKLVGTLTVYGLVILASAMAATPAARAQALAPIDDRDSLFQLLPIDPPSQTNSLEAQRYAQTLPAVGRDDLWAGFEHRVIVRGTCADASQPASSIPEHIAELARSTRVVIVNEAHDIPRHRKLTESLLGPLWDEGYRYFAAEAFSEQIDDYPGEAFGRSDTGSSYVSEPTFGSLIRTAKQLGYELVPYEAEPPPADVAGSIAAQVGFREEAQANNLVERVLAPNPAARVIVHVGYSHATEVPIPSFEGTTMAWMAARLKEKSGIDPLTIDQTYCRSSGDDVRLASSTDQMPPGTFDLAIAYPEAVTMQGRGTWRLSPGMRLVLPPESALPAAGRAIIEARRAGEPDEAIPVDRLLIRAGESIPLVLPQGEFRLTAFTEGSSASEEFDITVDAPQ